MLQIDKIRNSLIIVRGGGDLATGTIIRLARCGLRVLVLEIGRPTVIRRKVSVAQAMFDTTVEVEGVGAKKILAMEEADAVWNQGLIPVIEDGNGLLIERLKPLAVIDAIMAKKNLGTTKNMAELVIGLGPGFQAGKDVHAVIETKRGHNLGRVLYQGAAEPDTGKPGAVMGFSLERLVRATAEGIIQPTVEIGSIVNKGDCLATIGESEVTAEIPGVVRGMIQPGLSVTKGFKIGDIDPRGIRDYCFTISDKANAIAGGVLEALLGFIHRKG